MTPEAKARLNIDALLQQAGWHVCDMVRANIVTMYDGLVTDFNTVASILEASK